MSVPVFGASHGTGPASERDLNAAATTRLRVVSAAALEAKVDALHTLHPGIDTEAHYRLADGYHVRPLFLRRYGRGEQVVYVRTHEPTIQRKMGLQDWLWMAKPWPTIPSGPHSS